MQSKFSGSVAEFEPTALQVLSAKQQQRGSVNVFSFKIEKQVILPKQPPAIYLPPSHGLLFKVGVK